MIFVTVGTHEQQFNRLIRVVDELRETGVINEDVFVQTGYSDYKPKYCGWAKIIGYEEMRERMRKARVIITHGGPSSFMEVISMGKVPIVVPRQFRYKEHVNNHQVDFCKAIITKGYKILLVEEVSELKLFLERSKNMDSVEVRSNNQQFNEGLARLIYRQLGLYNE